MQPITLTDGVVTLAAPTEDDVEAVTALCQDAAIQEWTTVPSPYARSDAEGFVRGWVRAGWAEDRERTWGIRTDGVLRGMVGLSRQPVRSAEVGYWLGASARGQGILHRALLLVLEHAFDPAGMDVDRVVWHAYGGNWASWRAVWRVGFRFEGVVRDGAVQRDRRRDDWVGTLLRDDPREPLAPWPATDLVAPRPSAPSGRMTA
ncbi:GNAT family N-acetyltransferase [Cellulomonas carbonis]|uniref:Acetyltransferase n=1 Tax=Cellulomonas carbonis T26 TaxID=947969 RepID=A0A0A0BR89_9CELL|nr:GNAT family protein [Cellulomonas carbonis]KGM10988.1 acetyltransferase [Cellulomonas carbonis T26]GGB95977.1 putative acetyltransferase [Cellulomonas carbonis]